MFFQRLGFIKRSIGFSGVERAPGTHTDTDTYTRTHPHSISCINKHYLYPGELLFAIFKPNWFRLADCNPYRWHLFSVKCFLFPELRHWHHTPPHHFWHLFLLRCQLSHLTCERKQNKGSWSLSTKMSCFGPLRPWKHKMRNSN